MTLHIIDFISLINCSKSHQRVLFTTMTETHTHTKKRGFESFYLTIKTAHFHFDYVKYSANFVRWQTIIKRRREPHSSRSINDDDGDSTRYKQIHLTFDICHDLQPIYHKNWVKCTWLQSFLALSLSLVSHLLLGLMKFQQFSILFCLHRVFIRLVHFKLKNWWRCN